MTARLTKAKAQAIIAAAKAEGAKRVTFVSVDGQKAVVDLAEPEAGDDAGEIRFDHEEKARDHAA